MLKRCINCGKLKEHHAKDFCYLCYKKQRWIPQIAKKKPCIRCKNTRIVHTKGLCGSCYNFVFHIKKAKESKILKSFKLTLKEYKKLTKECILCKFNKIIELHHLDENKSNNQIANLVPLCPNHHKMIHNFEFRTEIRKLLQNKGIILKKDSKRDFLLEEIEQKVRV
jgi:hypothetical protein